MNPSTSSPQTSSGKKRNLEIMESTVPEPAPKKKAIIWTVEMEVVDYMPTSPKTPYPGSPVAREQEQESKKYPSIDLARKLQSFSTFIEKNGSISFVHQLDECCADADTAMEDKDDDKMGKAEASAKEIIEKMRKTFEESVTFYEALFDLM
jgi:hypothetical protein